TGTPPPGAGNMFSHAMNDSFTAINRLLNAGEDVWWITGGTLRPGAFYVYAKPSTQALVTRIAADLGVDFEAVQWALSNTRIKLHKMRIALADQYGGSMPSGWTRFLFEQFGFPFEVGYPKAVTAGYPPSGCDGLES